MTKTVIENKLEKQSIKLYVYKTYNVVHMYTLIIPFLSIYLE